MCNNHAQWFVYTDYVITKWINGQIFILIYNYATHFIYFTTIFLKLLKDISLYNLNFLHKNCQIDDNKVVSLYHYMVEKEDWRHFWR